MKVVMYDMSVNKYLRLVLKDGRRETEFCSTKEEATILSPDNFTYGLLDAHNADWYFPTIKLEKAEA